MLTNANILPKKTSTKLSRSICDDKMVTNKDEGVKKLLRKKKMLTNANIKNEKLHFCEFCNYHTIRRYNFDRHLASSKHSSVTAKTSKTSTKTSKTSTDVKNENTNDCENCYANVTNYCESPVYNLLPSKDTNGEFECADCKKTFIHRSSLSRHRQKCKAKTLIKYNESNEYMKKLEDLEAKIDTLTETAPKTNNIYMTVNNEIKNINIFLSKNCKDAMNMSDFISNVNITNDDLNYTLTNGYTDGITQLLSKHLNDLEITERTIHCSDKKRLRFYIKDEDKWSLDDNGEYLSQSISTLSNKQMLLIKDWSNSVIDLSSTQQIDSYQKMVSTLCDTTDKKTIAKIKKKISSITGI